MSDDRVELKNCPFCGSKMESSSGAFGHVGGHPNCPIYYTAFDDAEAGDWNTRTLDPSIESLQAEVVELKHDLERQMTIANVECNEAEALRVMLKVAVEALELGKRLAAQVRNDLASAHAEICKLQGLDPAMHTWPDWSAQANTLRWLTNEIEPTFDNTLASLKQPGGR